jgi:hypothetical protein
MACSIDLINKVRESVKTQNPNFTDEQVERVVNAFIKAKESEELTKKTTELLADSIFSNEEATELKDLVGTLRKAKTTDDVDLDTLHRFFYLVNKKQGNESGKLVIGKKVRQADRTNLIQNLVKLREKFEGENKTEAAKLVRTIIDRVVRAQETNKKTGKFLREPLKFKKANVAHSLLKALDIAKELEVQEHPKIKPLLDKRSELIKEKREAKTKEEKAKIEEAISKLNVDLNEATKEVLTSKLFIKKEKAEGDLKLNLYNTIKRLSKELNEDGTVLLNVVNDLINASTSIETDRQLFLKAKQAIESVRVFRNLAFAIQKDLKGKPLTVSVLKAILSDIHPEIDQFIRDAFPNKKKKLSGDTVVVSAQVRSIFNRLYKEAVDSALGNGMSQLRQLSSSALEESTLDESHLQISQLDNDTVLAKSATAQEVAKDNAENRSTRAKQFIANTNFKQLYSMLKDALERLEKLQTLPQFSQQVSHDMLVAVLGKSNLEGVQPAELFKDAIVETTTVSKTNDMTDYTTEVPTPLIQTMEELGYESYVTKDLPEFREPDFYSTWNKVIAVDIEIDKDGNVYIISPFYSPNQTVPAFIENLAKNPVNGNMGNFKAFTIDQVKQLIDSLELMQNQGWKVVGYNNVGFDFRRLGEATKDANYKNKLQRIALRSFDLMAQYHATYGVMPKLNNLGLAVLNRGKSREATSQTVIEDLLNARTEEDVKKVFAYAQGDSQLTFDLAMALAERQGQMATVDVESPTTNTIDILIKAPMPVFLLAKFHSPAKFNFLRMFAGYSNSVDYSTFAVNKLIGQEVNSPRTTRLTYDVRAVQQQLLVLMALSLKADPETRVIAKSLLRSAAELTAEEQNVLVTQAKLLKKHAQHGINAKIKVMSPDGTTPKLMLNISNGRVIYTDDSSVTNPEIQYQEAVIDAFLTFFTDTKEAFQSDDIALSRAKTLIKEYGYRDANPTETITEYATNFIKEFILPRIKATSITNLGDGSIDYAPAFNVGFAIAQLIAKQKDGVTAKRVLETESVVTLDNDSSGINNATAALDNIRNRENQLNESLKYQYPTREAIAMFSPISLKQYEEVYNDWALRQRVSHILTNERYNTLTEQEIDERLELLARGEYAKRVKVLANTGTVIPKLVPTVNNRRLYNDLPTLDDSVNKTIEAMLELPQVAAAVVHDSLYMSTQIVVDATTDQPLRYTATASGPGSYSAMTILNGQLLAQLAWYQTYGITSDLLDASVERTVSALKEGSVKLRNVDYFDWDFNGVHHMAMLAIAYSAGTKFDTSSANLMNLLKVNDWINQTSSETQDFYNQTADSVFEGIKFQFEKIQNEKTFVESQGQTLRPDRQELFDRLSKWNIILHKLDEVGELRDYFKKAVLPRLYQGGKPSISQALVDKFKEPELEILLKEEGIRLSGQDVSFLINKLDIGGTVGLIGLIDRIISIDDTKRGELKTNLRLFYNQLFVNQKGENIFHNRLKNLGTNSEFGLGIINLDTALSLINTRIDAAARMITKPIDESGKSVAERIEENKKRLQELWKDRIQAGIQFIRERGGHLKTKHERAEFARIMGVDAAAYKETPVLVALNAANRTALKLRQDIVTEAWEKYQTPVEEYLNNVGNYLFFMSMSRDLAGGRMYTDPSPISYQGPEYSQVATPEAMDAKDRSVAGMYDIERYGIISRFRNPTTGEIDTEAARRYIKQLVLQNFELRLATEYMAEDYQQQSMETPERFMEDWVSHSKLEREALKAKVARELRLQEILSSQVGYTAEEKTAARKEYIERKKRGILTEQGLRFLASYDNSISNPTLVFSETTSKRGVFAFRPRTADFDVTDLPIYSLAQLALKNRIEAEQQSWIKKTKEQTKPTSITDIIPESALGHRHSIDLNKTPVIPRLPLSLAFLTNTTDEMFKITKERAKVEERLSKFAVENGFTNLLQPGKENWAQLQYLYLAHRRSASQLMRRLRKLPNYETNPILFIDSYRTNVNQFMASIYEAMEFQFNTTNKPLTQLDFEYYQGFKFKMFKSKAKANGYYTYMDLLNLISKNSEQLSPLKFGLSVSNRTRIAGPASSFESGTRRLPITVQAFDAVHLIFLLFNLEKVRNIATDYVKAKGIAHKLGDDGFVIPESIPASAVLEVMNYVRKSKTITDADIKSVGLYIMYDAYANQYALKTMSDPASTTENMQPITTPLGFQDQSYVTDTTTKYLFTPEMLDQLLLALRNSVVFDQAELAYQTRRSIGERTTNLELGNLQRTMEYYNGYRDLKADEADIFMSLHENGVPLKTIEAGMYDARFGTQFQILDSIGYMAENQIQFIPSLKDKSVNFRAFEIALLMPLKQAITKAERRNQQATIRNINQHLSNPIIRKILPVVSLYLTKEMTPEETKILIKTALGIDTNQNVDTTFAVLYDLKSEYNSIVRPQRNSLYYTAKAYLQQNDTPTEVLEQDLVTTHFAFAKTIGLPNPTMESQIALNDALQQFKTESGLDINSYNLNSTQTVEDFANEENFVTKFVKKGEYFNAQIKSLGLNPLVEDMYRAMIGFVLYRHPELEEHLSISIGPVEGDRLAKMNRIGQTWNIVFQGDTTKTGIAQSTIERAIEVFSHEISHIALEVAKQKNTLAYEEAVETLQGTRGREAIQLMVEHVFQGSKLAQADINQLIGHYQANVDEALVFWGSFMLATKVFGKDAKSAEFKKIVQKNATIAKTTTWWKRAFVSISKFIENAGTFFGDISTSKQYGDVSVKLNKVFESFFEATASVQTEAEQNTKDVEDSFIIYSAETYAPLTEEEQNLQKTDLQNYAVLQQELNRLDPTSDRAKTIQAELEAIKSKYVLNRDHLGIDDFEYYSVINQLRQRAIDLNMTDEYATPETMAEENVLLDHIVRQVSDFRGKRVNSPNTAAYLGRQIIGLFESQYQMEDDAGKRNKIAQQMQYFATSFFGLLGNQSELTFNSPFGIIVSMANLMDAESQVTDAHFVGQEGLGGIKQNQYQVRLLTNQVYNARNELVSRFGGKVGFNALQKPSEMIIESFNYLVTGVISNAFTNQEQKAIKDFAETYVRSASMMHELFVSSGLKPKNRPFNTNYLAFKLDTEQFVDSNNPEEAAQRRMKFKDALKKVIINKHLTELQKNDFIHPITFFLSSGLPALRSIKSTDLDKDVEFLRFIEHGRLNYSKPEYANSVEGVIFHVMLHYAAFKLEGTGDFNSKVTELQSLMSREDFRQVFSSKMKTGYKELLRQSSFNNMTLSRLLLQHETNLNPTQIQTIKDHIVNSLNDTASPVFSQAKLQAMNLKGFPIKIKSEAQIFDPGVGSIGDILFSDFINTMRNSAATSYETDINPTIKDIFNNPNQGLLTEEEKQILSVGFSRDLFAIIQSLEKGLGQQAVATGVIKQITGVQGWDFLRLIDSLIEYAQQGGLRSSGISMSYGQFTVDKTTGQRKAKPMTSQEIDLFIQALNVLRKKYLYMWNVKSTLANSQNTLTDKTIEAGQHIVQFAWGPNQIAAGIIIDSTSGAVAGSMLNGNPLQFYYHFIGDTLKLLGRTFTDSWRFSQIRGEFADFAEILWDTNNNYATSWQQLYGELDLSNRAKSVGRQFLSFNQSLNMLTTLSTRSAAAKMGQLTLLNQLTTNNLEKIREGLIDLDGNVNMTNYYELRDALAKSGQRNLPSVEAILRMKAAGMFDANVLEGIKLLWTKFNLKTTSSTTLMEFILRLDSDFKVGDITRNTLIKSVGAIDKYIDQYVKFGLVTSNAMDAVNDDHPMARAMSYYRSYNILYATQQLLRDTNKTSLTKSFLKVLVSSIVDLTYQLFLAVASGFLGQDEVERLLKGRPLKETILKIASMTIRNPIFTLSGNTLLELMMYFGKSLFGEKGLKPSFEPLSFAALSQMLGSMGKNINKIGTAASDAEQMEAIYKGGLMYLPVFNQALIKMGVNQYAASPAMATTNSSGPRNTASRSAYNEQRRTGKNNIDTWRDTFIDQMFGDYAKNLKADYQDQIKSMPIIRPQFTPPVVPAQQQMMPTVQQPQQMPTTNVPEKQPSIVEQATTPIKAPL